MNTMLMSLESKPCATSVLQLVIGFRHYHITRSKQNHQSLLSSTASYWARRTRRFSKAKVIRSVAIPSPRPLWSLIFVDTTHLAWRACGTRACLNTDGVYAPAPYGHQGMFIIRPGSSDTPESQAQHLSSRGPVLACTTTRLDHAKRKESS